MRVRKLMLEEVKLSPQDLTNSHLYIWNTIPYLSDSKVHAPNYYILLPKLDS